MDRPRRIDHGVPRGSAHVLQERVAEERGLGREACSHREIALVAPAEEPDRDLHRRCPARDVVVEVRDQRRVLRVELRREGEQEQVAFQSGQRELLADLSER